ncbi:hypothetical protein [Piscinibacter gummiphilus]|uniref:hypothetical protein n=1 Tax=Piscinibacter gummiphilus TaxID=946333 RepID=UPI0012F50A42|nr:hypothetical protein [Piscinibacter gummiphilus]
MTATSVAPTAFVLDLDGVELQTTLLKARAVGSRLAFCLPPAPMEGERQDLTPQPEI